MYKIASRLFVCLTILSCDLYADLSVYFSNVKQANCIILKDSISNVALIIDCGAPAAECVGRTRSTQTMSVMSSWDSGVKKAFAQKLLSGVNTWVIITHQHIDHCSLLPSIRSAGANIKRVIVGGGKEEFFDKKPRIKDAITENLAGQVQECGTNFVSNPGTFVLPSAISGVFGPDSVQFLLPKTWIGGSEHDQNIVVKVKYGSRVLLFPGDANGKLLDHIIEKDSKALSDIDFLVLSHHGSNDCGELAWFTLPALRVGREKIDSMLTMVSSDPSGEHSLPWHMIRSLSCGSKVDYCAPTQSQ